MALITFISDFGTIEHYVASVKAKILSISPNQTIVDITHEIRPYDIANAATILKSVYQDFPVETVHLVSVDSMDKRVDPIVLKLEGQIFVGSNSGLFSLISDKKPDIISRIIKISHTTFLARDVLAEAAAKLAQGYEIQNLGEPLTNFVKLYPRQVKVSKRVIVGHVINVDRYGNLTTNIQKADFEKICQMNGENVKFLVVFGKETSQEIHTYYTDVESGDYYLLFNSLENLQIGINKGNASELLGIKLDDPIHIQFSV